MSVIWPQKPFEITFSSKIVNTGGPLFAEDTEWFYCSCEGSSQSRILKDISENSNSSLLWELSKVIPITSEYVYFLELIPKLSWSDMSFVKLDFNTSVVLADTTTTWPSLPPQKISSPYPCKVSG